MSNIRESMTVKQLKESLEGFDDDTMVYFVYDYGDHCHTKVASHIAYIEPGRVRYDSYTSTNSVVEDEENHDDCEDVLLIY